MEFTEDCQKGDPRTFLLGNGPEEPIQAGSLLPSIPAADRVIPNTSTTFHPWRSATSRSSRSWFTVV